ncbi:hypothetical protein QIT55_gp03 [Nitrosopumilus spindle-shaped virus]|uniref:Uncharacterized protein n=1 Tax=Nitrosopumilus spindle-shaped virus 1 TaxID=2848002 RepID=A0A514K2X7_9VIRU|nr:hypothetical protein QIT55_gp03 [Nitrosopumilus spindle-shaped virus]QDI73989.1 hypothetical protein [Nitrosopumilus spindle-shaped virus]
MTVTIECKKCKKILGFFNRNESYKKVSAIVDQHKLTNKKHRVIVKRTT